MKVRVRRGRAFQAEVTAHAMALWPGEVLYMYMISENEGCMEMRKEVSRGKFNHSSSHPLGKYSVNTHYVLDTNLGALVNKMHIVPALMELIAN